MKYTVIIEKGRESGYVAFCPTLKGCVAQGKTKKESLKNLKLAIEDYLECLIEDGITLPKEEGKEIVEIEVAVK